MMRLPPSMRVTVSPTFACHARGTPAPQGPTESLFRRHAYPPAIADEANTVAARMIDSASLQAWAAKECRPCACPVLLPHTPAFRLHNPLSQPISTLGLCHSLNTSSPFHLPSFRLPCPSLSPALASLGTSALTTFARPVHAPHTQVTDEPS